jgi:hypothetical protein
LSIANIERDGDELHLDGFMAIANLKLNHPKSKDVVLKHAKFDYRFFWGQIYLY